MAHIREAGVSTDKLDNLFGKDFPTAVKFKKALSERLLQTPATQALIMSAAEIDEMEVTRANMDRLNIDWFTIEQRKALEQLEGREFVHKWQLHKALAEQSSQWRFHKNDQNYNRNLQNKFTNLYKMFRSESVY